MDQPIEQALPAALIALAIGVLLALWLTGQLSPRVLRRGPGRSASGLDWVSLLITVALLAAGMLAVPFVGQALRRTGPAPGGPVQFSGPELLVLQLVAMGPAVVYVLWQASRQRGGLRALGVLGRSPLFETAVVLLALPGSFVLVAGVSNVMMILAAMAGDPQDAVGHVMLTVMQEASGPELLALVLLAVVVAPVTEELLYRGLLQTVLLRALGRRRRWLVIVAASLPFAVIHLSAVTAWMLPSLFVFGLVLGWLYERTGSLWPPILVHAGFNAANVALAMSMMGASGV
jgi:membrane protease YdiL (CAAX protease family)